MFERIIFKTLFNRRQRFGGVGRKILSKINTQSLLRKEGVEIGNRCRIQSLFFGTEPYLIKLGDHVHVGTDVQFITHDGAVWVMREIKNDPSIDLFGTIRVGNNVFIGNNAIILPKVNIGNNVIVAAGAVVAKDVPSGSIVAGVPAKVIGSTEEYTARRYPQCISTKGLNPEKKKAAIQEWLGER